jgi:hypothetical protein
VEEGKARDILKLEGFEGRVEVGGRRHVVKAVGWSAELEESRRSRKLLRIRITAEVDGVRSEYTPTADMGKATQQWDAPTPGPTPPAAGRQTRRG